MALPKRFFRMQEPGSHRGSDQQNRQAGHSDEALLVFRRINLLPDDQW